ncbi:MULTISPECIES: hypothetical protein [Paenibacillus]|uniref:hypothetical protein n=1 Tax=Paenibacillus TaxID=44249 RepID=UPI0024333384|nr:hypothetical protein [Paenibacillus macerans]MBS5910761.1 hypothetical protein [Paenibacillus macerans]
MSKQSCITSLYLVLLLGILIFPKEVFAATIIDNQMNSNPFNRGSISSGQWVDSVGATTVTATWSDAWSYENNKDYEIKTSYNIMSYGSQYYAELNLGLMRIVYSRDGISAVYVKDGDIWKTHVMTTKGNYVWKLIYTSEKQYQVYRNSVLVASGKVENLPADTKFSITSKVNNEKFSLSLAPCFFLVVH